MIFTTVGTTQFDELVDTMDKIAPELDEEVVIQIGNGKNLPKNCKYFSFDSDLHNYLEKADIVISHGGAGVTFEVLNLGKKLICVENPHALEGHQRDLLQRLSEDAYLIWCKDLNEIADCIKRARTTNVKQYLRPECDIGKMIINSLEFDNHVKISVAAQYRLRKWLRRLDPQRK